MLLGFFFAVAVTFSFVSADPTLIKAGIILTQGSQNLWDYDTVKASIRAAYEASLERFNVEFQEYLCLYQGDCSISNAVGETYICGVQYRVDLIIGPGCTDDMMASLEAQTYLNIPSVTGGGTLVDSTAKFPYITRVSYNTYTQWTFFSKMCLTFNWTNVAILYNQENSVNNINMASLGHNLVNASLNPIEFPFAGSTIKMPEQAMTYLQNASLTARVMVFLMNGHLLRRFMTGASYLGYTNGDYAFVNLDAFRDDALGVNGWKQDDVLDRTALAAYQTLMVLTLRDTSQTELYQQFVDSVNETAQREFPGMKVQFNYYVASFYDSVLLYALSVNKTLERGESIDPLVNINNLSQTQWNQSFTGATGAVYINPLGDRNDDHSLYGFGTDGKPYIIADFYGYKIVTDGHYKFDQLAPFRWSNSAKTPPVNEPHCGYRGDKPICDTSKQTMVIALGAVGAVLLVSLLLGTIFYRYHARRVELAQMDLLGNWHDITKVQTFLPKTTSGKNNPGASHLSLQQKAMFNDMSKLTNQTITADFRETRVIVRVCEVPRVEINSEVLYEIRTVRALNSDNILALHGLCPGPGRVAVMYSFSAKGSVSDLLASTSVKLDWIFKFSVLKDILYGLTAVCNSPLVCHGRLTSKCCFVDAHFVARVADNGLPSFFRRSMPLVQDSKFCSSLLWTAPELLHHPFAAGTQEADVYAYAVIMSEVIMRETPFASYAMDPEMIIAKVQHKSYKPFRPRFDANECPPEISVLMKQCWAANPLERPRLAQIKSAIKESEKGNAEQGSILDTLIRRMETHTMDLQNIVEEKAQQFQLEKEKSEQLLYQILPRVVVDQLKKGGHVKPEDFDSVTVFYSDIVSFTTLSSKSSPSEVVNLLNDLYTTFDACIMKFDAFKVETIGDCYVVASGVPTRNGNRHAVEICRMSMMLLEQIKAFKIRHRPNEQLKLRLGAHTGPCVSGVVGLVMPRFCLFGETIIIANKMESTSHPMKIQISVPCEKLLQTVGNFETEPRGELVKIKEGLEISTFWLQREIF